MLTIRGRLITPFVLGSMSVGLNILIRHSFMDLWVWISALVPWPELLSMFSIIYSNLILFGSVVRALDFYPGGLGSIPRKDGIFFQLCFIPLLRLSCRKMGARPGLDFICRKWLHVIINDDFLPWKGGVLRPSTPTFDYLPWQITHSFLVDIQSLTTASESRLFGSVVRALDFYPGGPGSIPRKDGIFFQLCFIPLLRLSCLKTRKKLTIFLSF